MSSRSAPSSAQRVRGPLAARASDRAPTGRGARPQGRAAGAPPEKPAEQERQPPSTVGDLLPRVVFDLITLANVMRANQEHFASYVGLNVPRFLILRVLEDSPGSTVTQIATRLEVTSQFVTLETGRLADQGLVAKQPHARDRRSIVLDLTPLGRQLLSEVRPLRESTNEAMFRSLGPEELAHLHAVVERLIEDGRAALHQLETPGWQERRAPSAPALR